MPRECFTAYISVNHRIIESFTTYYYHRSEEMAKHYIKKHKIKGADILVEETTDKFMDSDDC